jgi:hypothetical protein
LVEESRTVGHDGRAALLPLLLVSPFRSISRLEAENAALRHQLIVLQRQVRGLRSADPRDVAGEVKRVEHVALDYRAD